MRALPPLPPVGSPRPPGGRNCQRPQAEEWHVPCLHPSSGGQDKREIHMKGIRAALLLAASPAVAQGVAMLEPEGAIQTTGTWGLAARAGDMLFVAGMRGIDPQTNQLVDGDEARIR